MENLTTKINIGVLFYYSLLLQVVLRIITFLIQELGYNGVGYISVIFGFIWFLLLIPLSLILGFIVIKRSDYSFWLKLSLYFLLTILVVISIGFVKI